MKKLLLISLVGLLALSACNDKGDEPEKNEPIRILLNVFTSVNHYIYDTHGKLVYECPEGCSITKMAAEGKDWYGVLKPSGPDPVSRVLKNGEPVYSTSNEIASLCVENGDFYTMQLERGDKYMWKVFKNDRQLYEYDYDLCSLGDLSVDHGDLIARARHDDFQTTEHGHTIYYPTYWINGEFHSLPAYEEDLYVSQIVKQGKDTLAILINHIYGASRHKDYWWKNGVVHQLTDGYNRFSSTAAMLSDGYSYIAGNRSGSVIMLINTKEYTLNAPSDHNPIKMRRHGYDVYTLTSSPDFTLPTKDKTRACIFRGTQPVEIDGKITVTEVPDVNHSNVYNLTEVSISDFVVLDN